MAEMMSVIEKSTDRLVLKTSQWKGCLSGFGELTAARFSGINYGWERVSASLPKGRWFESSPRYQRTLGSRNQTLGHSCFFVDDTRTSV